MTKTYLWVVRFWMVVASALIWWESGFLTLIGVLILISTFIGVHEKLGHPTEGA
jgi:hypothetical protein